LLKNSPGGSVPKIDPVEMTLDSAAGKLSVGDAAFPIAGLAGEAKFGVEVFGAEGDLLGASEFATELAGKRYAEIRSSIQNLESRLSVLPNPTDEAQLEGKVGVAFWLQRAKALAANEARPEAVTPAMLEALGAEIREIAGAVETLENGGDPYAGRTGSFVRAYRSPLTGQYRPHALFVPSGYDPKNPLPMIVVLHGIFGDERHLFQMTPSICGLNAIVYQAASYRQLDWADLSAAETWAGLDQVLGQYAVDRDRISLIGHHIGGRGALQLAMDRPGFFSAAAPMFAGIDAKPAYPALALYPEHYEAASLNHIPYPVFKKPARPDGVGEGAEKEIYERLSLATRAENLAGLPMRFVTGEHDPDAAAEGLALEKRLGKLGVPAPSTYVPGAMHGSRPPQLEDSEWHQWLIGQRRNAAPDRFTFVCTSLRENSGWFVRIDELASALAPGRLTVDRDGKDLKIETEGVSAFAPVASLDGLDPAAEVALSIDGQRLGSWKMEGLAGVGFAKSEAGAWQKKVLAASGKRHGQSGPIDDFQRGRLLYVYGTAGSPEENARLEKVAKKISNRGLGTEFPCKADSAVTDEEIRDCHLVLLGSPSTNRVTAKVVEGQPLKWEEGKLRLGEVVVEGPGAGACLVYPSPLANDRYIVVLSALDEAGYRVWETRAGVDYSLGKTEGKGFHPTIRGVFANDWSLKDDLAYRQPPGS
jgi:pimeloyl-ACP methyl ester carboxylesterase